MNSNMFQGEGAYTQVVGKPDRRPPIQALKQGSVGPTMSDLQRMLEQEQKQHEQEYIYAHGHNDGSAPGYRSSF